VYCRNTTPNSRRASDDILPTTVAASALPRILKVVFDQERLDRGSRAGIFAAFPSQEKVRRLSRTARGPCRRACFGRHGAPAKAAQWSGAHALYWWLPVSSFWHTGSVMLWRVLQRGLYSNEDSDFSLDTEARHELPAIHAVQPVNCWAGDNHEPRGMKRRSEFIWAVNV
jgi:hypothetical protein